MILYSSMTVREAIDEVLDKVSQLQTATNLDYKTAWMFLNRARREVFARTLAYKDSSYVKKAAVSNGSLIPADFTRKLRVILHDGADEYVEARFSAPQEWWRLTNSLRPHTVSRATVRFPVYTIWGSNNNVNDDRQYFYCSPTSMTGYLEYYAAYSDLPVDANNDPIDSASLNVPYEYENLVIQATLIRCYARLAESEKMQETFIAMQSEYAKLKRNYMTSRITNAINQQALVDPQPSMTPSTSLTGDSQVPQLQG